MRISRRAAGWLLVAYATVGFTLVLLGGLVGLDAAGLLGWTVTSRGNAIRVPPGEQALPACEGPGCS
jgi:hypothetical protein